MLVKSLKSKRFKLYPYDPCLANKQMKGKQKLNTQSSNESELVGGDGMMPIVVWSWYLLMARYEVAQNILLQDNGSTILMECLRGDHNQPLVLGTKQNGKASSGKNTGHVNIGYSFISDRLNMKEISIDWCPTKKMVADFMTKPQEGSQFRELRHYMMGKVRCIRCNKPNADVVGLGQKKASKKLIKESEVNGKWCIHSDRQQVLGQGHCTIKLEYHRTTGVSWGLYSYGTYEGQTISYLDRPLLMLKWIQTKISSWR